MESFMHSSNNALYYLVCLAVINFFGADFEVFIFLPFFPLVFYSDSDFTLSDLYLFEVLLPLTDYFYSYLFLIFVVLVFFLPDLLSIKFLNSYYKY